MTDYNRGTFQNYNDCHDEYCLLNGWTQDQIDNGKSDCYNYNKTNGQWDILSSLLTLKQFNALDNTDGSDDCVWEYVGDTITINVFGSVIAGVNKLTESERNALVDNWYP